MTFPTTHWTLLASATINGEESGRQALNELCRTYRVPVLAYFKSKCASVEDAEDLTQALFGQILEARAWRRADRDRGQFRGYLLGMAQHALRNWQRWNHAAKRNGGRLPASLDLLAEAGWEPTAAETDPDHFFDREWARSVLAAAWGKMRQQASSTDEREKRFAVLRQFLPGGTPPPSYEEAADGLKTSADHVKVLVHRMRVDFAHALRAEVATTVSDPQEVDAEMKHLRAVMTSRNEVAADAARDFL